MTAEAETAWRSRIVGHANVPPTDLVPNPENWRSHPQVQRDALGGALSEVGWVTEVIVNKATGHLVDGHLRLDLALSKGEPFVPVTYVELTHDEERLVLATLDPLAAMADAEVIPLQELLAQLDPNNAALRGLLDDLGEQYDTRRPGLVDPDEAPDVRDETYVNRGDVFVLGDHRLMCGDATDQTDIVRLMGGSTAAMVFTDPPYGVGYDGGTKVREKLVGDDAPHLYAAVMPILPVIEPSSLYLCFPMRHVTPVYSSVAKAGWATRNVIIWNKNLAQFGNLGAHYHEKFEPIVYATKGTPMPWYGPTNEVTVWDIDRATRNEYHPTQKPVALVERALSNSSRRGDIVWDGFMGSGSTIIAAEQLGRRAYGMDIDPRYVQVAIERWQTFTGREAVKQ